MLDRRTFLAAAASLAPAPAFAAGAVRRLVDAETRAAGRSAEALASDEDFWEPIQRAFDTDRSLINLNSGGCSPAPSHVLEQMIRDLRYSNELPVLHMWQHLEPRVEAVRRDLAHDFGCEPEEMAIIRNASEGLETLILGVDLQRGDEVITADVNYGRMTATWDQRRRREGIVVRMIALDLPQTDDEIVRRYVEAVTPRTKAVEVTHINNLNGQIFPVRRLVEALQPKGIKVFVDGAHAYAHFPFTRDALACDFYATSLHKWLCAPVGSGFLYVRKSRIPEIWPLLGSYEPLVGDIRKYEEFGTHPAANHNAVGVALAFHRAIGADRKVARLRWLRDRWIAGLRERVPQVQIKTPLEPGRSGGLALFAIPGVDPDRLASVMMAEHRVVCTPIGAPFFGIRVTPNIFTTRDECDRFAELVAKVVTKDAAKVAKA